MKKLAPRCISGKWLRQNRTSIIVLAVAVLIFVALCIYAAPEPVSPSTAEEYAEYENAVVTHVLSDTTFTDESADNAIRGEQLLLAEVKTGRYEGEILQVSNYVGPMYGVRAQVGDGVTLLISTYKDGSHSATVYEYNRMTVLLIIAAVFIAVTVAVGGKVGAKSLVALAVTLVCLFRVLVPLLLKGAPTLLTVFLVCAYITVVTMVILNGVQRKSICAMLGTVAGTAIALLFGLAAQSLARVDGLRLADVEPLLQLRQAGTPIGLSGLLVGGIVISALGAVMDVAMSIASAMTEVHTVAPKMGSKELFRSGMNIGRDMVGTMTNTLILAFLGSGFSLVIYLFSLGMSPYQLISSAYLTIEAVSGISSSIGVILAVPLTALISSVILTREKIKSNDHP